MRTKSRPKVFARAVISRSHRGGGFLLACIGNKMGSQKAPVKAGKKQEVKVLHMVKASDQP